MKKFPIILILGLFTVSGGAFSEQVTKQPTQQATQQDLNRLQMAREGCQKPIGYFPTPSKLMCLLTALGVSEKEVKAKALALMFNVCHGRTLQPQPAGFIPKKYDNLGNCLKDPDAITLINKELTAQGFPSVKVTNPGVLTPPVTPKGA